MVARGALGFAVGGVLAVALADADGVVGLVVGGGAVGMPSGWEHSSVYPQGVGGRRRPPRGLRRRVGGRIGPRSVVRGVRPGHRDLDLVVGRTKQLALLANVGGRRYVSTQTLPGGLNTSWLATGDLDGDGDTDLVASEGPEGEDETDGTVWAWENEGDARWSDAGRIGATGGPALLKAGSPGRRQVTHAYY